jgi:UDP-N-acetylglucosamine-lysosomal-enzyme
MEAVQDKFRNEFARTSANRFRAATDIQFAFAYYYFLMSERHGLTASSLFDEIDVNKDKQLDEHELDLVHLKLVAIDVKLKSGSKQLSAVFLKHLNSCRSLKKSKNLERSVFIRCKSLTEFMRLNLRSAQDSERVYKYEKLGEEDVGFVMLGTTWSIPMLGQLQKMPQKFVCINDDIDYNAGEADMLLKRIADFYTAWFPSKSQFEL